MERLTAWESGVPAAEMVLFLRPATVKEKNRTGSGIVTAGAKHKSRQQKRNPDMAFNWTRSDSFIASD